MSKERRVLDNHEYSTMVSTWTRYLCVRHVRPGVAAAEICQYEPLCEFNPYDEDGNEIEIPSVVDGKHVIRFEDGYLVGGELGPESDDSIYEYNVTELADVTEWIEKNHFHLTDNSHAILKKALQEPV